jgi:hypothetical protein
MTTYNACGVTLKIQEGLCEDILCTAIEGGINHWAEEIAPVRQTRADDSVGWVYVSARIGYENEDGDLIGRDIDREKIAMSIATILQCGCDDKNLRKVNEKSYQYILEAVVTNDASMIDADIADIIVQVAIFGEYTYG